MRTFDSLIGCSEAHTAWCTRIAKDCIKAAQKKLGNAWNIMGPEVRSAFVDSQVLGIVAAQSGEEQPVWKLQELIQIAHQLMEEATKKLV